MLRSRHLRLALASALLAACAERADTIYSNGTLLTLEAALPHAEALATRGDRILAVGSREQIEALAGGDTRRVDLAGHTLAPGFVDAHSHLLLAGRVGYSQADLRPPPMGAISDLLSLQQELARFASQLPPDAWLVGVGYDDTLLRELRHPTRADLDAVASDRPVVILHVSYHVAVANSVALSLAGIDASTPDPAGGAIQRDAETGEPNGVLEEGAAIGLLLARMPKDSLRVQLAALARATRLYASQGVTTAQEGLADLAALELLLQADEASALGIRVIALPSLELARAMAAKQVRVGLGPHARLGLGAAKLIADGSIQTYTAQLSAPYHTPPGGDASYRGYPSLAPAELDAEVGELYAGGFQVAIHANGDAAIDAALHAIEAAQLAQPRADDRPVLIHAQMARPDQLDAMRRLHVIPSFFVLHTYYWGDRHRDVFLGPERAARISPTKSAQARGLRFTLHADTPVTPMEPLRMLWAAVNRRTTSGAELGPEERISPEQALRAITLDAAYQYSREHEIGSLAAGKLADLVILSEDPLRVAPERIAEIRVLRTVVGGETVYVE